MYEIILAATLGIVQGLTEFLPISSSGHLLILHHFFSSPLLDSLAFDAFLHLGTLVALIFYFKKDLSQLAKALFIKKSDGKSERKLIWLIIWAILPAGIVGFLLGEKIEQFSRSLWVVAIALIVGGLVLYLFDRFSLKNKQIKEITWPSSLIIGLAQVLAFIPGVSRSAITIIAGLGLKLKRDEAARFSFLIAIPLTLAAGLKAFYNLLNLNICAINSLALLIGFIASALSGFFCIKYFLTFLQKRSFLPFVLYRLIIGLGLVLFLSAI